VVLTMTRSEEHRSAALPSVGFSFFDELTNESGVVRFSGFEFFGGNKDCDLTFPPSPLADGNYRLHLETGA